MSQGEEQSEYLSEINQDESMRKILKSEMQESAARSKSTLIQPSILKSGGSINSLAISEFAPQQAMMTDRKLKRDDDFLKNNYSSKSIKKVKYESEASVKTVFNIENI